MISFVIFFVVASSAMANYAGSNSGSNKVGNGNGYSGSFLYESGFGGPPPPFPQFYFNTFLQSYFDSLQKYHEQFAAHFQQGAGFPSHGFPNGFPAYGGFPGQGGSNNGYAGGFGNSFNGNLGSGQEGASASASIGPQGTHQTAGVYPENSNSPNIDNRFGEVPQKGDGGFYSVSTSSQSGSSNIDGKPSSFHQATTTVNNNGNVTTFTVQKP